MTLQLVGEADTESLEVVTDILRNRIDSLGVAEPEIIRQGQTVVVNLPGIKDQDRAIELVGRTGKVLFRPVVSEALADDVAANASTTTVPGESTTTVAGEVAPTVAGATTTTVAGATTTAADDYRGHEQLDRYDGPGVDRLDGTSRRRVHDHAASPRWPRRSPPARATRRSPRSCPGRDATVLYTMGPAFASVRTPSPPPRRP